MINGLLAAISALTILRVNGSSPPRRAFVLSSFPLVGLLFGALGFLTVIIFQARLPFLTAWLVPLLWLILSGGTHFLGLSKSLNAFLAEGDKEDRFSALSLEGIGMPGTILAVMLLSGKIFALLQSQILDTTMLALTVLLTPVVARYVAVMMAIGGDMKNDAEQMSDKLLVFAGASIAALLLCSVSLVLALALLVTSLIASMLLRWIAIVRLGSTPPPVLGALVEISETAMLWMPVICTALGLNLSMLQLPI